MGMTIEELAAEVASYSLYDSVRDAVRVSSTAYDSEVYGLIGAAVRDMLTKGVSPTWLGNDMDSLPELAKQAVIVYAKANFGFDNDDADRFQKAYDSIVCTILNSSHNAVYEQMPLFGVAIVTSIDNQTYTGQPVTPALELAYPVAGVEVTLVEGTDYEVTYERNVEVGWAIATATGIYPFTGEVQVPFYIEEAE